MSPFFSHKNAKHHVPSQTSPKQLGLQTLRPSFLYNTISTLHHFSVFFWSHPSTPPDYRFRWRSVSLYNILFVPWISSWFRQPLVSESSSPIRWPARQDISLERGYYHLILHSSPIIKMADHEQPYDPYIPSASNNADGSATQHGDQRTTKLQEVSWQSLFFFSLFHLR